MQDCFKRDVLIFTSFTVEEVEGYSNAKTIKCFSRRKRNRFFS